MKAFMGSKSKKDEYPAFTNFTIKVHLKNSWQDTVNMVVKSLQGVTTFKMQDDGKINISGYIDPARLLKTLKKAGKKAEMVHWQYGECSNNLFENTQQPVIDNAKEAGAHHLYPSYGYGYGYGYGYACGNNYGYNYDYPTYGRNYAYNHLECSGNAEDCNGHHLEQPKTSDKASFSIPKKITSSKKDQIQCENVPKCCCLM